MGIILVVPMVMFILAMWNFCWDGWTVDKFSKPFRDNGFFESAGLSLLISLLSLLASFIGAMIIGAIFYTPERIEVGTQTTSEIYALADNSGIEGSFFLGSGSIDEEMKYVYVVEVEGKGYKMHTIDADSAYVQYYDGTPKMVETTYWFKSELLNFFGICPSGTEYIFYIPEGSITNSYVIDLE